MRYQLVARVDDPELLDKSADQRGTVFYQQDRKGNITRVVYFSTSRVVEYTGKVDEKLAQRIRVEGYEAQSIKFDENSDSIEVTQTKTN